MEFTEEIKQFAKRVVKMSSSVSNEESTKMSMIVPFFSFLDMMSSILLNFTQNIQQMLE